MHNCIYALIFFHGFICILGIKFCPPCEEWLDRAIELQCPSQNKVYVCMLDDSNQILEKCIDDFFIQNGIGGCPFINVRKSDPDSVVIPHRDAYRKCPEEITGCPPKNHGGYNLSEICKYPRCTHRYTDNTSNMYTIPSSGSHTTISYDGMEIDKRGQIILSVLGTVLFFIVAAIIVVVYKCKQKRREYKDSDVENSDVNACALESLIPRAIGSAFPFQMSNKHKKIYNDLETLLFSCNYTEFATRLSKYNHYARCTVDVDLKCHLFCLKVHSRLFQGIRDKSVENSFFEMKKTCDSTSNPFYFRVQLLSTMGRFYFHTKETDKLKTIRDAIVQDVDTDRSLFRGRSAGWLFFDCSRYHKQTIRDIIKEDVEEINQNLTKAETYLKQAIQCFNAEETKESDHCKAISKLEMVALKSRWFGKRKVGYFNPKEMDLKSCEEILGGIEYSNMSFKEDVELKAQFLKAQSILFIRKNNKARAKTCLDKLRKLIHKYRRNGMKAEVEMMTEYVHNMVDNTQERILT